jgi:quinol---cytochrome c reductase iron-sulfur subunit, bacillus type
MDTTRRNFLMKVGIALNVVAATLIAVPVVGYIASAMRKRSYQAWVKLGPMSDFPPGETRLATYTNPFTVPWDGKTSNVACWVRHLGSNQMQVFAVNCAHLGCPVRWFPESRLFMCPCHGGVYYEDGERASGPPPRGLFQYEYEVRGDELWVRGGQMPTLANAV